MRSLTPKIKFVARQLPGSGFATEKAKRFFTVLLVSASNYRGINMNSDPGVKYKGTGEEDGHKRYLL